MHALIVFNILFCSYFCVFLLIFWFVTLEYVVQPFFVSDIILFVYMRVYGVCVCAYVWIYIYMHMVCCNFWFGYPFVLVGVLCILLLSYIIYKHIKNHISFLSPTTLTFVFSSCVFVNIYICTNNNLCASSVSLSNAHISIFCTEHDKPITQELAISQINKLLTAMNVSNPAAVQKPKPKLAPKQVILKSHFCCYWFCYDCHFYYCFISDGSHTTTNSHTYTRTHTHTYTHTHIYIYHTHTPIRTLERAVSVFVYVLL